MKSNQTEIMNSSQSTSVFCFGNINWTDCITWMSINTEVLETQASCWAEKTDAIYRFSTVVDTKEPKLQKSSLTLSQAWTIGDELALERLVHGKAPSPFLLSRGGSKWQPCHFWLLICDCWVRNYNGGHALSAKWTAAISALVWHVPQVRS